MVESPTCHYSMTSSPWINTLSRSNPTRAETIVQKTSFFLKSVKLTANAGQHGTGHEIAGWFADPVTWGIILVTSSAGQGFESLLARFFCFYFSHFLNPDSGRSFSTTFLKKRNT